MCFFFILSLYFFLNDYFSLPSCLLLFLPIPFAITAINAAVVTFIIFSNYKKFDSPKRIKKGISINKIRITVIKYHVITLSTL